MMLTEVHLKNIRSKYLCGTICVLLIALSVLFVSTARAQVIKVGSEYKIKAAFIYNLAQFTEWPADTLAKLDENFSIGVLGTNPFDDYLDEIAQEKLLKKRKIEIIYSDSIRDIIKCQVIFISASDKTVIREILQKIKDKSILTISDQTEFTQMGGIVNFINVQGKVRFAINIDAADRAKLRLSSNLLKLAKIVAD